MIRTLVVLAALAGAARADDKGIVVDLAGMKSAAPADWKEAPKKEMMRTFQLVAPKVAGGAGPSPVAGRGAARIADALAVAEFTAAPSGEDVYLHGFVTVP